MKKIFKNMLPYWKSIILIVVVLVIQAYCDLALPTYTADIIDVGIQNKGIEHILPQEMTSEEYENAQLFMTKEEKTLWASSYEATQHKTYECSVTDKDTLDELDSEFAIPLILNYQMSQMEEDQFKEMLATQNGQDVSAQLSLPMSAFQWSGHSHSESKVHQITSDLCRHPLPSAPGNIPVRHTV